jgi:hypothetical protein
MNFTKKIAFGFFISALAITAQALEPDGNECRSRASSASPHSDSGDSAESGTFDDRLPIDELLGKNESCTSLLITGEKSIVDLKRLLSARFPVLKELMIQDICPKDAIQLSILFLKKFRNITSLDLSHIKIGSDGAKKLSPLLGRIKILALPHCNIGKKGFFPLARNLKAVEELNLSLNPIGVVDLCAIAGLKKLKDLELRNCNIIDTGVMALASTDLRKRISFLDLDGNRITKKGLRFLSYFKKPREIHLADNDFSQSDMSVLSSAKKLTIFLE